MNYKNAKEILPAQLLEDLQEFCSGGMIYVPKAKKKARWGELSGSRMLLDNRNTAIKLDFKSGWSINDLSFKYYLSEYTIRKIIYTK